MHEVLLVPLDLPNNSFIQKVREELQTILHSDVSVACFNIDPAQAYSKERNQYYSTSLIAQAAPYAENFEGKIILIMQSDLYVPVLTYVFGEAQLNGKISIVSLCRLHEEFYTGHSNDSLLLKRTIKEILHELGHNYGLFHCRNWDCVMHSSSSIEEVDIKGDTYCNACIGSVEIIKY